MSCTFGHNTHTHTNTSTDNQNYRISVIDLSLPGEIASGCVNGTLIRRWGIVYLANCYRYVDEISLGSFGLVFTEIISNLIY